MINWPDIKFPPVNQSVLMCALSSKEQQESSPCVGVCKIEDSVCKGCHRTLQEIADWPSLSGSQKIKIKERIECK